MGAADGRGRWAVTHPLIQERRAERAHRIDVARRWAGTLPGDLRVVAVVVIGSVARGDFNKWSDLDVLVVAEGLPADMRARLEMLHRGAPAGLQPIGWTPSDLVARHRRGDPIAREAATAGVTVRGTLPPSG